MKRIIKVTREPGGRFLEYGEIEVRYPTGATGTATVTKEGLLVQRLMEKMVDSGVPEADVEALVDAAHDHGWEEHDISTLED